MESLSLDTKNELKHEHNICYNISCIIESFEWYINISLNESLRLWFRLLFRFWFISYRLLIQIQILNQVLDSILIQIRFTDSYSDTNFYCKSPPQEFKSDALLCYMTLTSYTLLIIFIWCFILFVCSYLDLSLIFGKKLYIHCSFQWLLMNSV